MVQKPYNAVWFACNTGRGRSKDTCHICWVVFYTFKSSSEIISSSCRCSTLAPCFWRCCRRRRSSLGCGCCISTGTLEDLAAAAAGAASELAAFAAGTPDELAALSAATVAALCLGVLGGLEGRLSGDVGPCLRPRTGCWPVLGALGPSPAPPGACRAQRSQCSRYQVPNRTSDRRSINTLYRLSLMEAAHFGCGGEIGRSGLS